jgi:DNA-binding beta-propeller fold protein YncE
LRLFTLLGALVLSACGGCGGADTTGTGGASSESTTSTTSNTASATSGASSSTGAVVQVDRGPTAIPLDGDPNGLWWDSATATLYIADDNNNRILQWTDGGGIALVAELPNAPPNGAGLGQLVKTKDGKILVTRFGFGTVGDIVYVAADKTTGTVPNLDPMRRRIGLTIVSDGSLYDSYFVKTATGQLGAVAKLDLAGTEVDFITGLKKPVGVLASGPDLFVSDQATGTVTKTPIVTPKQLTVLAQVDGPDLLCEGPDGSFFTGGTTGDVRQITSDGKLSTFAGGFLQIRGVAYDAVNKRVFAAEHDPVGSMNAIHILPVN